MPTYVYACILCGEKLEVNLTISNRDRLSGSCCPWCHENMLARQVTSCAFAVHGANASNGYSTNIADIEKRLGREVNNNDFPE